MTAPTPKKDWTVYCVKCGAALSAREQFTENALGRCATCLNAEWQKAEIRRDRTGGEE